MRKQVRRRSKVELLSSTNLPRKLKVIVARLRQHSDDHTNNSRPVVARSSGPLLMTCDGNGNWKKAFGKPQKASTGIVLKTNRRQLRIQYARTTSRGGAVSDRKHCIESW
jgi:hypothetical protein